MTTTSFNIYQQITSVRLASTVNLSGNYFNGTLNNGVGATLTSLSMTSLSVDGISVQIGDRLLLKDQTSINQNGLYVVQSTGGSRNLWILERSSDFQSLEQLKIGQYFSVGAGDTLSGSIYVLVEPLPSAIGLGSFNFINVADAVIPAGPFLLKASNFTDVANPDLAFTNLGTGTGQSITITDGDFLGGIYQINVPFPAQIVCNNLSVGGQEIRLPVANTPFLSPALGQGVILKMIDCVSTGIALSDGTIIDNLQGFDQSRYICSSKSSSAGSYSILPELYFLNTLSGRVDLTSNDSSIIITPNALDNTIDLSAGPSVIGGTQNIVWVGSNGSDITGSGTFDKPFATLSHAIASITIASPTNQFTISLGGGTYNDTNIIIKPWINIDGNNATINLSGGISNDSSWYTTNNADAFIQRCIFIAPSGLSAIFNGGNSNIINYMNCDFTQTSTLFTSTNNTSTAGNLLVIQNNIELDIAPFQGGCIVQDSNVTFIGGSAIDLNIIATGGINVNATASINLGELAGTTNIDATASTGGFAVLFANDAEVFSTVNLKGVNTIYGADAGSYYTVPNFSNGASISNVQIPSLADSLAQTTFTPVAYIPENVGGLWPITSATANFAGIDTALKNITANESAYGEMFFQDNATVTTISAPNTPVKVNATYSTGLSNEFTQASGTLTYTGSIVRTLSVIADLTATYAGTSQNTSFYIAHNGVVIAKSKQSTLIGPTTPANHTNPVTALVSVNNGDTLEIWVENNDNSNSIIITDLNFNAHGIATFESGVANISTTINGMSINGSGGVNSSTMLASHETRVNNIVTGSFKIQFNSNANNIFFTITKSYGGAFVNSVQALGSGTCAQTPTAVLGDAQVTSIQSVTTFGVRPNILVATLAADYILECSFTYEVI
ncbi:MAG: hypothetical protein EPO02_13685 [Nitrospirae bacterium]|nr:MAG: hypothetical protein EPO02_13685 [Nitrospirota bacterium]